MIGDRFNPPGPIRDDAERVALIERILLVLLVVGLFIGVIAIVRPFFTAILFGATLATAAWPLREALVRRGFGHAAAAWTLLVIALALIALPIIVAAPILMGELGGAIDKAHAYFAASPPPPAWLTGLPLIGERATAGWKHVIETGGDLHTLAGPYAADIQQILLAAARALTDSIVQVILSLVVATMFWANGEALVGVLHDALRRIGGAAGENTLDVAALAIRGVAYGVVGTALIQALLLVFGLAIAGIPGTPVLGFIGLLLAISQIGGPLIVLIWGGAAWWLFAQDYQAWGVFMIVWGLVVSTIDNFVKPWLIGFGIEMPLSLTVLGVFGGFVAFGFLGLFVGPALIGVLFTLLQAWRTTPQAVAQSAAE